VFSNEGRETWSPGVLFERTGELLRGGGLNGHDYQSGSRPAPARAMAWPACDLGVIDGPSGGSRGVVPPGSTEGNARHVCITCSDTAVERSPVLRLPRGRPGVVDTGQGEKIGSVAACRGTSPANTIPVQAKEAPSREMEMGKFDLGGDIACQPMMFDVTG